MIQLGNLVVPFSNCKYKSDGKNVIIIIPCEDEKHADDLVTSLGAEPSL